MKPQTKKSVPKKPLYKYKLEREPVVKKDMYSTKKRELRNKRVNRTTEEKIDNSISLVSSSNSSNFLHVAINATKPNDRQNSYTSNMLGNL